MDYNSLSPCPSCHVTPRIGHPLVDIGFLDAHSLMTIGRDGKGKDNCYWWCSLSAWWTGTWANRWPVQIALCTSFMISPTPPPTQDSYINPIYLVIKLHFKCLHIQSTRELKYSCVLVSVILPSHYKIMLISNVYSYLYISTYSLLVIPSWPQCAAR